MEIHLDLLVHHSQFLNLDLDVEQYLELTSQHSFRLKFLEW